ncbi:MAG: hypothetical protein ACYDD1_04430, partial [Caulobacteraceae bacterium]
PVEDLQRWQFIAAQSHVSNQQLESSFDGLTATLGKLKSGIRDQRLQPFLDELGLSEADIAKAHNASDMMDLLISKMAKIKDPSERVQIADAFGMSQALPLFAKTRDEIAGMTDDFHRNAAVISGEQAAAIEKQNEALERTHELIQSKIREDLAGMAQDMGSVELAAESMAEKFLGALASMERGYAGFVSESNRLAQARAAPGSGLGGQVAAVGENALGRFNNALTHPTTDMADLLGIGGHHWWDIGTPQDLLPRAPSSAGAPTPAGDIGAGERTRAQAERATKATDDFTKAIDQYVTHTSHAAEMQKRIADDRANGANISKAQEGQLMTAARAEDAKYGQGQDRKAAEQAKKAMEEGKASDDAIAKAKKDELEAHIKLTADLAAEHSLRLSDLAAQRDTANRQTQQDAAMGKISPQAARQVVASNNGAYDDKVALENRQYQQQQADQQRTYNENLVRYQIAHLNSTAAMATTADDWATETKQAFALQQQVDRANFVAETNKRTQETGANHLDASQAQAEIAAYDTQQAEQTSKEGRDVDLQVLERKRAFADQLQGYTTSTLEAEANMATTAAQRQAIELQLLQIRQQQARQALADQIRKEHIGPDQAAQLQTGLAQSQAAETSAMLEQQQRSSNPLYAYAHPTTSVGEDTQVVAEQGIEGFTSDLVNATTNVKNFGDSLRQTALQVAQSLLKEMITRDIAQPGAQSLFSSLPSIFGGGGGGGGGSGGSSNGGWYGMGGGAPAGVGQEAQTALGAASGLNSLLGSAAPGGASSSSQSGWYGLTPNGELDSALTNSGMDPTGGGGDLNLIGKGISDAGMFAKLFGLPGLQDGSDDAQGGPTLVGESGPEVLNLPHGASVTNNNQLLSAMGRIQSPQGGGTVTMNHQINVDVTGANGDDAIRRIATQAAAVGTAHAIAQSRSDLAKSRKSTQRSLLSY